MKRKGEDHEKLAEARAKVREIPILGLKSPST